MVGALWRAVVGWAGRGRLMNGNSALTRTALMYGYANWEHPHKICTGRGDTKYINTPQIQCRSFL